MSSPMRNTSGSRSSSSQSASRIASSIVTASPRPVWPTCSGFACVFAILSLVGVVGGTAGPGNPPRLAAVHIVNARLGRRHVGGQRRFPRRLHLLVHPVPDRRQLCLLYTSPSPRDRT